MIALDAGLSMAMKRESHVKCWATSSRAMGATGTPRCRPMTSATSRMGTPSSATACKVDPAGAFVESQREQMSRVEPVHRGPAVGSVADVTRKALLASDRHESGHKAAITQPVIGRREAHDGGSNAPRCQGKNKLSGSPASEGTLT